MKKVASLTQLRADRPNRVTVGWRKIVLVRDGDEVRAYSAVCPHAGAPLEEGVVCAGRIVCPWHKGVFRVGDGALVEPPPLSGLDRYPVRVSGDDVFVGLPAEPPQPTRATIDARRFAIVGAGASGATAAAALREFGFGGTLLLIGREPGFPFDRTSLSKFVVAGEMAPEDAPLLLPETFYADRRIERVEAEVVRFDAKRREIWLADGRRLGFDRALVAPGGEPRRIDLPNASLYDVYPLRSREDAAAILAEMRPGVRVAIVGASFIGLEVASCLRARKAEVVIVAPEDIPFARQFGERVGRAMRKLHEDNGVKFEKGKPAALAGEGHVARLVMDDGRRIEADVVVIGVGVRPATDILQGLELTDDGGVVVDAGMRACEAVYAAGDVASFPYGGGRTRIEHWRVAQSQARVAAANMLGGQSVYDATPFFWTYHYGRNFEYLGHASSWDEEVVRGDVDAYDFVVLLMQRRRVVGVVACGRQRLTSALCERMRAPLSRDEALQIVDAPSD